MALYDTFNQISPSLPPVGLFVLTVLFPLAFVPAVADIKACTSDPIATPKFVLDVPAADLVLMYEPVPSAIRSIQRRGRTARQRSGTVKTLVAVGTRDQFVSHAAKAKERKMHSNLKDTK